MCAGISHEVLHVSIKVWFAGMSQALLEEQQKRRQAETAIKDGFLNGPFIIIYTIIKQSPKRIDFREEKK